METLYEVNGQPISKEQFEEMQRNPNIKLVEISPGKFKTLQRMHG